MSLFGSLIYGILLAKDGVKTYQHKQIAKKYTYTLPNGVVYYRDGGTCRRLDNDRRLFWERGSWMNDHDPNTRVVYFDDMKTVVYDAEQWRESQVSNKAKTDRYREKINLRAQGKPTMIYDNVFKQYVALVKKIYLKEDNKYFYKTYFFYDMYMEDFLKRGGNPNIDPDLMAKPFYNSTKRGANNGIIIKESHIEQLLELTKKHHMMSVDYSTEVYENKEQYMQLEKNKWWESKDIIPEDCGQLIDRECQL